jgi:hypothetical protein
VRDGHHRVSVARALGQRAIEAKVLACEVAGPLPWQTKAAGQTNPLGRLYDGLLSLIRPLRPELEGEAAGASL